MTSSVLHGVEGFDGRTNTVVHQPPLEGGTTPSFEFEDKQTFRGHVVVFPGDIQGFREEMSKHHICAEFASRCYEATVRLVGEKFPLSHVWLVVPARRTHGVVAVYKNFVPSESLLGIPSVDPTFGGIPHLEKILESASATEACDWSRDWPIALLAFSKGAVVLNQFLHEVAAKCEDKGFLARIKSMFWLDGGHSGEENVWVTDPDVISNLTPLGSCKFFVHVTPYQVRDPHRPWKGEAEREFVEAMKRNGMSLVERTHFEDLEPSIELHFKILEEF